MLADKMEHQPWIHNWKRYVSIAVTDVKMASRDPQGIVADILVQMDSNHVDVSFREVKVKFELLDQPAGLLPLHSNAEAEPRIGPKLDIFAHQFLELSCEAIEPGDVVVRLLEPAVIRLFCQIMTKVAPKPVGIIDHQIGGPRLRRVLPFARQRP
jgi:hypothetical protein